MKTENRKPIKIIFDTDIGGDCDDAGALLLLHRLCDKGEAELLAVTACYASPYVAGCIDAINRYNGRTVPVGVSYGQDSAEPGVYASELSENFPNAYPASVYGTDRAAPDTLSVLRKTLAGAEDHSVTLVATGSLHSMARLITSGPDTFSPKTGRELVREKIARTVVMGGRFFESWPMTIYPDGNSAGAPVTWEWNIRASGIKAARTVCDEWEGELVFSSYEIGSYIRTMVGYPDRAPADDPVARAYEVHNHGAGRCSWDLTAMLDAVRPGVYWSYHAFGQVSVDDALVTHWTEKEGGRHTYLLPKDDYETVRKVLDDLIDGK